MKMQTITTTTTTTTTRRRKEKFVRFSYNIFFRVAVEPLRFLHQFFYSFFQFPLQNHFHLLSSSLLLLLFGGQKESRLTSVGNVSESLGRSDYQPD